MDLSSIFTATDLLVAAMTLLVDGVAVRSVLDEVRRSMAAVIATAERGAVWVRCRKGRDRTLVFETSRESMLFSRIDEEASFSFLILTGGET